MCVCGGHVHIHRPDLRPLKQNVQLALRLSIIKGKNIIILNICDETKKRALNRQPELRIRVFFFSDYLEVTTAVVLSRGVGKKSQPTSIYC